MEIDELVKDLDDHYNEYETTPVPKEKRKSLFTMLVVMSGFSIFAGTISVGSQIAANFNIVDLILISIIGNLLLATYITLMAYLGGNTGLGTHKLSQNAFGKHGYKIGSVVVMIAQFGWFGVGIMMFSSGVIGYIDTIHKMSNAMHIFIYATLIISFGALLICSAFFGIKALEYVSMFFVPLIIILGIVMMCMAPGVSTWNPNPTNDGTTFSHGIELVFATFAAGGTLVPDFVRWAKNGRDAAISVVVAFFLFSTLMLIFGGFAYWSAGTNSNFNIDSFTNAFIVINLAIPGLFVLGGNIWTSCDNTLYTVGMASSSIFNVKKRSSILVAGIIGILLAPFIYSNFIPFLGACNLFVPGIGAIIIANGYILKEDQSEISFDFIAIGAWIGGLIFAYIINLPYVLPFILPLYVILFTLIFYLGAKYIVRYINIKKQD